MDLVQKYVIPYTTSPLIISLAQFSSDKFFYDYDNYQALYDSILSFTSQVGSKIASNILLAKTVGVLDNYYATNILSYLSEPLLNSIFYSYLYLEKFKKTQVAFKSKGENWLMITPFIQSLVGIFLDRTVVEWLTGYNVSNPYSL